METTTKCKFLLGFPISNVERDSESVSLCWRFVTGTRDDGEEITFCQLHYVQSEADRT